MKTSQISKVATYVVLLLASLVSLNGQTIWTGATDTLWFESSNWSTSNVPDSTTNTQIAPVSGDEIILDTSGAASLSIQFNNTLTASTFINSLVDETLTIGAGGITNADNQLHGFGSQIVVGASSTFSGGTGGIQFGSISVGNRNVNVASSGVGLLVNGQIVFDITSVSTFGRFSGAGPVNFGSAGLSLNVTAVQSAGSWTLFSNPTGALGTGVSFASAFYTGSLTELTPGTWSGAVGGLNWSFSESTGVLTAVPEPSTWLLLTAGLTSVIVFRRRRS